jgi:predicted nucleic acid-binding protein
MVRTVVSLDERDKKWLDRKAREKGVTMTTLVRQAIRELLRRALIVRAGEPVFVDTGAWIALALTRDALHARARDIWERALGAGVTFHTSVPVVLETSMGIGPRAM